MFKKPVKLTVTVMPTQTAGAGEPSEANIIFDGKTFTVTFGQTGGVCGGGRCVCGREVCVGEGGVCGGGRGGWSIWTDRRWGREGGVEHLGRQEVCVGEGGWRERKDGWKPLA